MVSWSDWYPQSNSPALSFTRAPTSGKVWKKTKLESRIRLHQTCVLSWYSRRENDEKNKLASSVDAIAISKIWKHYPLTDPLTDSLTGVGAIASENEALAFCICEVVAGQIRQHAIPSCLKAEDRLLQFITNNRHQANFVQYFNLFSFKLCVNHAWTVLFLFCCWCCPLSQNPSTHCLPSNKRLFILSSV